MVGDVPFRIDDVGEADAAWLQRVLRAHDFGRDVEGLRPGDAQHTDGGLAKGG